MMRIYMKRLAWGAGGTVIQVSAYTAGCFITGKHFPLMLGVLLSGYFLGMTLLSWARPSKPSMPERGSNGESPYRDNSAAVWEQVAELKRENAALQQKKTFPLETAVLSGMVGALAILAVIAIISVIAEKPAASVSDASAESSDGGQP